MIVLLLSLAACGAATPCEALCETLVLDCGFGAYPSVESCIQGCAYEEEQGGDVAGQLACVEAAACDPFEVLECERAHGVPE